jgi:hypothetical protein
MVALHPDDQVVVTKEQDKTCHMGVLTKEANSKMAASYLKLGYEVCYYGMSQGRYSTTQYLIYNGPHAWMLNSFEDLDMTLCVQLPNGSGQRHNLQYTVGIALEKMKMKDREFINNPQNKKGNVESGLLPYMATMSQLLHDADPEHKFHATAEEVESC